MRSSSSADATDFIDEIGNAQLVLGRALLEQGGSRRPSEMVRPAESSFEQLSSESHRAAAWIARATSRPRAGTTARPPAVPTRRRGAPGLPVLVSERR